MKQNLFVDGGSALVSKVTCDGSLRESIERSVELIGGLDRLVKRGDTILLKPNYNTADPFPGSSDPEFVKAVIKMLYEAGAERVILGERTAFLHSRRVLERAGIVKMAEELELRSECSEKTVGMHFLIGNVGDASEFQEANTYAKLRLPEKP